MCVDACLLTRTCAIPSVSPSALPMWELAIACPWNTYNSQDDEEEGAANGELVEAQHSIFGHCDDDEEDDEEELREIVSHFHQHRTKRSSAFTSPKKSKNKDSIGKIGLVAASPRHQVCFVRVMNEICYGAKGAELLWWFIGCTSS